MHARPSADSVLRKMPPPDNRRPHDLPRRNRKKTLYLREKSANSDAKTPATHKHFSATPQFHSRERKNPPNPQPPRPTNTKSKLRIQNKTPKSPQKTSEDTKSPPVFVIPPPIAATFRRPAYTHLPFPALRTTIPRMRRTKPSTFRLMPKSYPQHIFRTTAH